MKLNKRAIERLRVRSLIRAKIINKFPDIFIEPSIGEIVRLFKNNTMSTSCRAIIEPATGLIVFDSQRLTHASAAQVLEDDHAIHLPKKLAPEHQLTLVTSKTLDYKNIYVFTSMRAYKNPIDDLKKISAVWPILSKEAKWAYVPYDNYDDARYYLSTMTNRQELLNSLKGLTA